MQTDLEPLTEEEAAIIAAYRRADEYTKGTVAFTLRNCGLDLAALEVIPFIGAVLQARQTPPAVTGLRGSPPHRRGQAFIYMRNFHVWGPQGGGLYNAFFGE